MAEKDKLAELYDFLKHDVEVSFLDGDVIDVAMDVITKLIDRIKELEKANKDNYWIASDYKIENLKLEQQNKRYCEIIQDLIDYADDYNIPKAEKYRLRKELESESE